MFSYPCNMLMSLGIGKWPNLANSCVLLSVRCLLGTVMCLCACMPAQLHAFMPTAMCILCRLVCEWVHVLQLHIRYQITFSSRVLAFLLACQSTVTTYLSTDISTYTIIPNLIFKLT